MMPWSVLDTVQVPGGGQLRLKQRGAEFSIMLDQNELMNSRLSGSEEALATIACEKIRRRKTPRILIGGLGMGFTLRAALGALGPGARIVVAELVPAVVVVDLLANYIARVSNAGVPSQVPFAVINPPPTQNEPTNFPSDITFDP